MKNTSMLEIVKPYYDLGFALIWLRPRSKIPWEAGWTSGPRADWAYLEKTYRPGNNVGVRLGTPSKINGKYLAVIDVDVKSTNPKHRKEAYDALAPLIGKQKFPTVSSGRGNGSAHLYCLTDFPFKTYNPAASEERIKYLSPSKKPSKEELNELTKEEIKKGYRFSKAWEISLYSDGRQVVIYPSVHPDSGNPYLWKTPFEKAPTVSFDGAERTSRSVQKTNGKLSREKLGIGSSRERLSGFEATSVQLDWLDAPKDIVLLIKKGIWAGREVDNSDYMPMAITALLSAGCDRNDVLTVMTDPDYALGRASYRHAGETKNREVAANWAWHYGSVKKAMDARDPKKIFSTPFDEELLSGEELQTQSDELKAERDWRQDLKRGAGKKDSPGPLLNCLVNIHLILNNSFGPALFKFNEFSKQDEVWQKTPWGSEIGREFQERDIQKIKLWMCEKFGFQPDDANIWSALVNIADKNSYHPIKTYLEALPPHDGVARLDYFLERYLRGEAPKKYMQAVSRKTVVAMIARVYQPGIKFDTMLVLEGDQGLRKSTAVMTLASKPWFTDVNLNLKHKDSIADMSGKWVMEQGEMNVLSVHDVALIKQFLSRDTDRMRPSYGRKSQDYPRQSVFIGTTNEDIYLKDTTGSRRFWPIKVTGDCDIEGIIRDRDQIFAEALAFYKAGEPLWIGDADTNHLARAQQAERETVDELTTVISEWISRTDKQSKFDDDFDPDFIRMVDLFVAPGPLGVASHFPVKMDDAGQKRVARCLRKLGYTKKDVKHGGRNCKTWVRSPLKSAVVAPRGDQKSPIYSNGIAPVAPVAPPSIESRTNREIGGDVEH